MNKWYKCVCLSFCLSLGAAQTKQTAVFMKQGRATRVFCLVVHFSTPSHTHTHQYAHTNAHMHTHTVLKPCAPHLLPALLCCLFAPLCFLALLVLSLSPLAQCNARSLVHSLSDREECHSVWPLTYNEEGCRFRQESKGAAAVMCPGLEGNTHRHKTHRARLLAKIHTR